MRSLQFAAFRDKERLSSEILLASASQDKYVRIWKFGILDGTKGPDGSADLSLKVKSCKVNGSTTVQASLSTLLVGHDDWVYTAKWSTCSEEKLSEPDVSKETQTTANTFYIGLLSHREVSGNGIFRWLHGCVEGRPGPWMDKPGNVYGATTTPTTSFYGFRASLLLGNDRGLQ